MPLYFSQKNNLYIIYMKFAIPSYKREKVILEKIEAMVLGKVRAYDKKI